MDEKSTHVELPPPRRLEREISEHRSQVRALVSELDRRRQERLNLKKQLQANGVYYGVGAGALLFGLGGAFTYAFLRRRKRRQALRAYQQSLPYRLRVAASRWLYVPEVFSERERGPKVSKKALSAAATKSASTLAGLLTKRAGRRFAYL